MVSDAGGASSSASLYGLDARPPASDTEAGVSHKKRKDKDGSKKERKEKKHKGDKSTATTTNDNK